MLRFVIQAAWLLALVPLWMIWQFGSPLPVFDDWDFVFYLHTFAERGELTTYLPWQANESRPIIPRLIALPVDRMFHGDLRARMVIVWLLMCGTAWLLWKLGRNLAPSNWQGPALLLANAFLFSPVQSENWVWGNQVMFLMPLPCLAGILYFLCRPARASALHIGAAFVLATIATWSFASGILCWLVLLTCLWLRRLGMPALLVGVALFLANVAMYFGNFGAVQRDSLYVFRHPVDAIRFLLSLLGSPLALGHEIAAPLLGAVIIAALAFAAWRQRHNTAAWPFLILAVYSMVAMAIIASGRLEIGLSQAFASRYTTVAVLAYVALVWLAAATIPQSAGRWAAAVLGLFLSLHAFQWDASVRAAEVSHRATRFAHLCLSLPRPTEGDCSVFQTYPRTQRPLEAVPDLERLGLLTRIPVQVPKQAPPSSASVVGSMNARTLPDHRWNISGTVHVLAAPEAVFFVADEQVWAAAYPNATKAGDVYFYNATLPSAIRTARVYIFRKGDWAFAGEVSQP